MLLHVPSLIFFFYTEGIFIFLLLKNNKKIPYYPYQSIKFFMVYGKKPNFYCCNLVSGGPVMCNVDSRVLLTLLSMSCYMYTCITYVASSFHFRRLTKRSHQYLIYYSAARLDLRSIFISFFWQTIDYSSCTQNSHPANWVHVYPN